MAAVLAKTITDNDDNKSVGNNKLYFLWKSTGLNDVDVTN